MTWAESDSPTSSHDRASPACVDRAQAQPRAPSWPPLEMGQAHGEKTPSASFPFCWAIRFGPCHIFSRSANLPIIQKTAYLQITPFVHASNNFTIMHRIKTSYICKMLRISSSFIISHFHPCLKCLNCCLH